MIIKEIINIRGIDYIKHSSDSGKYVERDGVLYSEAIDPIGSEREYTESVHDLEQEVLYANI